MSEKKYIVVLGDGMADEPIESLGGKTPIAYASTPALDRLSKLSEIGMVHTIPEGMKPGSDTANLSVLGYDPKIYYSGRSPLEAASLGIDLAQTDVTYRCNLVTLSGELVFRGLTQVVLDGASIGPFSDTFRAIASSFIPDLFGGSGFHLTTMILAVLACAV